MDKQYTLIICDESALRPFAEKLVHFNCSGGTTIEEWLIENSYDDQNYIIIDHVASEFGNTHDRRFNTIQMKTIINV